MQPYPDDFSMVFEGAAGQGVQTITALLLPILKKNGYHFFSCTEYMSRIRGGSNTTEVRITGKKRQAYTARIDLLLALTAHAFDRLRHRLHDQTLIFAEKEHFGEHCDQRCIDTPLGKLADEAGGKMYANTVALGIVLAVIGIPLDKCTGFLREQFADKGEEIVENNLKAVSLGYNFGQQVPEAKNLKVPEPALENGSELLLMDGTSALGIGAVAAGCNFICSYPMSPGTGVLTFLAKRSADFGIVVDQAEDEIAAINAGLGASYAGARALVTTSGGGFDLMQEGFSLAGMIETPIVIHIGQRPGPATGLPTRMEQGDLALALHAGHGEFARAIYAPGTLDEAVETMQHAFNTAQQYQIPVVVLSDQYLLDAETTIAIDEIKRLPKERGIVETEENYRRYAFTENGLTPRGVPGFGAGIVRADSDEHDEQGLITESFEMRQRMMDKRLMRLAALQENALPPKVIGDLDNAEVVAVSWGSNRGVLEEALDRLGDSRFAGVHYAQVFPLRPDTAALLGNGRRNVAVIENNALGQFADLLQRESGIVASHRILKATGEPFSVEEIIEKLREVVNG
ncbi:MAG: 2-oxoacid:acceptor oxidoreductase subunit alpha [Chlorobiaceae bacterium]|nr:2-oxoacid:acceptor oxidoreductase subunit alpha [Chlorobiaceae bacterium]